MIKCFEANYPESLGVCVVHKAPWLFQGIWKIIRGWLDPVVAAKVHFTNNVPELEEYVDRSQIVKEMGGDDPYEYEYIPPVEGENKRLDDAETRNQLEEERAKMVAKFEELTAEWIGGSSSDPAGIMSQRYDLAAKLRQGYWDLDPYVRARSLYDRIGVIQPGGKIDWSVAVGQKSAKVFGAANDAPAKGAGTTAGGAAAAAGEGRVDTEDEFYDAEEGKAANVANGVEDRLADQAANPNAAPQGAGAAKAAAGVEDKLADQAATTKLSGGPTPAGHDPDAID